MVRRRVRHAFYYQNENQFGDLFSLVTCNLHSFLIEQFQLHMNLFREVENKMHGKYKGQPQANKFSVNIITTIGFHFHFESKLMFLE